MIDEVKIVDLPHHLFNPSGAESLDIRRASQLLNTSGRQRFLTLKAENSETININSYALFTDIQFASNVEFFIRLNGGNPLRYHGVPDDPVNPTFYRLCIGVSPDFSNDSLIPCQIKLNPGSVLTVDVEINVGDGSNPFPVPLGVRLSGYVQTGTTNSSNKS